MHSWIFPVLLLLPTVAWADADGDHYDAPADCNDDPAQGGAAIYPTAVEILADGIDENCDGREDCYLDQDGDGFGSNTVISSANLSCVGPGVALNSLDCHEQDADIHPNAAELPADGVDQDCDSLEICYTDEDGDGIGGSSAELIPDLACSTFGYAATTGDCNSSDPAIKPFAPELCDDIDNDCNGVVDDLERRWFTDRDFDGYGNGDEYVDACPTDVLPSLGSQGRWVLLGTDCAPADPGQSPGRQEFCDGIDNDCDGLIDNGIRPNAVWFIDADHDGYGRVSASGSVQGSCPPDNDYTSLSPFNTDCKDTNATIHPLITSDDWVHPVLWGLADESNEADRDPFYVGDGIDQDCDAVDLCYFDGDDDKFGAPGVGGQPPPVILDNNLACSDDSALFTASNALDCDDADRSVGPGVSEITGDGVDQDCDGHDQCFVDEDFDGYGSAQVVISAGAACGDAADPTADRTGDCDDSTLTGSVAHPGAQEICDAIDNNCNGEVDEVSSPDATVWFLDADGDAWGDVRLQIQACGQPIGYVADAGDCNDAEPNTFPENEEVCDGIDNNCVSGIDENSVCATTVPLTGCHGWGGAYAMFPLILPWSWRRRRPASR